MESLNKITRKQLTLYKDLHSNSDVDVVYVDRNGEDWLVSVENVVKQEERQLCGRLWGICDGSNSRDGEDQWRGETENRKTKQVGKVMCSQSVFMCLHTTTVSISVIIKKRWNVKRYFASNIIFYIFRHKYKFPKTN